MTARQRLRSIIRKLTPPGNRRDITPDDARHHDHGGQQPTEMVANEKFRGTIR